MAVFQHWLIKMVKITEELIRKKAEHNECIIGTLEEISLHQEHIEKIENIHNWCKDLQILLLQSNLISKIENLNKLKMLKYLNLAINNIETVENLERCESLEKLDLTLNFIGDIESVCKLTANISLKELYLTGNPCTDYKGYRDYVIANLPQIECLDNTDITRSERLKALQILEHTKPMVLEAQTTYNIFRAQQKERLSNNLGEKVDDESFWQTKSEHAPEVREEISKRTREIRNKDDKKLEKPKVVQLLGKDGRPLNINQAKIKFHFDTDDPEQFILDLSVYKYLDTNLMDVDLQPNAAKVSIKGKIFQVALPEEIYVDKSTAQRSQTTGHLVIKMPKVNYKKPLVVKPETVKRRHEYLEVGKKNEVDFSKIVVQNQIDDIPPLEYGC